MIPLPACFFLRVAVFSGTCTVQLQREETRVNTPARPRLSTTTWVSDGIRCLWLLTAAFEQKCCIPSWVFNIIHLSIHPSSTAFPIMGPEPVPPVWMRGRKHPQTRHTTIHTQSTIYHHNLYNSIDKIMQITLANSPILYIPTAHYCEIYELQFLLYCNLEVNNMQIVQIFSIIW